MTKQFLLLVALAASPTLAHAQSCTYAPNALGQRTYRLGVLDSTFVATPPTPRDSACVVMRNQQMMVRMRDSALSRFAAIASSRTRLPANIECAMPVTSVRSDSISRAVIDSVADNPPGNPTRMPLLAGATCKNPLRR